MHRLGAAVELALAALAPFGVLSRDPITDEVILVPTSAVHVHRTWLPPAIPAACAFIMLGLAAEGSFGTRR